jgi:hypothetical protein
MTKDELWQIFIEAYPTAADPEFVVKLRARGLRRLLDQAWDEGRRARDGEDIFTKLFGGLKK